MKENVVKNVIGMAYVPKQMFKDIYPIDQGFWRGTMFKELDKPFECGCRG